VALMADDLSKLPYLFHLSRVSRRIIRQNVAAAILIKAVLVAGVIPGMVSLIVAVVAGDMGAALGVTGNALRLARLKPTA
jgi:Cd2+/Zn2+-exporting ATPase